MDSRSGAQPIVHVPTRTTNASRIASTVRAYSTPRTRRIVASSPIRPATEGDGGDAEPLKLNVPSGAPGWYPSFLPDGRHLLVYVPSPQDPEMARVTVIALDSDTRTDLVSGTRSNAVFAAPGHLLFWRDATLLAQPFDASRRQLRGTAVALAGSAGLNRHKSGVVFGIQLRNVGSTRTTKPVVSTT
jgi:hypothetical protein